MWTAIIPNESVYHGYKNVKQVLTKEQVFITSGRPDQRIIKADRSKGRIATGVGICLSYILIGRWVSLAALAVKVE